MATASAKGSCETQLCGMITIQFLWPRRLFSEEFRKRLISSSDGTEGAEGACSRRSASTSRSGLRGTSTSGPSAFILMSKMESEVDVNL